MLRAFYLPSHTRREALEAPDNQLPHAALLRGCGRRKLGENEGTADDAYKLERFARVTLGGKVAEQGPV